eukprot:bmy_16876T0
MAFNPEDDLFCCPKVSIKQVLNKISRCLGKDGMSCHEEDGVMGGWWSPVRMHACALCVIYLLPHLTHAHAWGTHKGSGRHRKTGPMTEAAGWECVERSEDIREGCSHFEENMHSSPHIFLGLNREVITPESLSASKRDLSRWQKESLRDEGQKTPIPVMIGGKKALLHTYQSFITASVSGVVKVVTKRGKKCGHPAFRVGKNPMEEKFNPNKQQLQQQKRWHFSHDHQASEEEYRMPFYSPCSTNSKGEGRGESVHRALSLDESFSRRRRIRNIFHQAFFRKDSFNMKVQHHTQRYPTFQVNDRLRYITESSVDKASPQAPSILLRNVVVCEKRNVPDDDVRGPEVTRTLTMQQPAEYLLLAEANDKRSHLQRVDTALDCCSPAKVPYWMVPRGTGEVHDVTEGSTGRSQCPSQMNRKAALLMPSHHHS